MVIVNGDQSIVGFPIPEENELPGTNGWVAGGVVGKGSGLKVFHVNVRERAAGGLAHAKTLELFVVSTFPPKIG